MEIKQTTKDLNHAREVYYDLIQMQRMARTKHTTKKGGKGGQRTSKRGAWQSANEIQETKENDTLVSAWYKGLGGDQTFPTSLLIP